MSVVSSTGRSLAQVETVATSYAVPSSAPTGLYTWEVTALDNDRKIIGVARSTFTVDARIKVVRPSRSRHPRAPVSVRR